MFVRPNSVYRVITGEDWEKTQAGQYVPLGDVDERDGFVHLSTMDTVLETADLYFKADQAPLVLEVDAAVLGEELKWEPVASRGGMPFPHLYAPGIPKRALIAVVALEEGPEGFALGERTQLRHTGDKV